MSAGSFEDPALVAAMRAFVAASDALDHAAEDGQVIDLAQAKSMAGMAVRKRLSELGWSSPAHQRTPTA
ncbi:MAG: hypothetical protein JWM40_2987 [Frankiales bacterium]|nr:hypothetical protein [Frankiales bacterium]